MKEFLLILSVIVTIAPTVFAKPFWTEKSSFVEGDRVFFVGVATNQKSIEIGRKSALENAKTELSNYLQIASTKGITFQTQMTHEEKIVSGGFDVYRLMYVEQEDIAKFKASIVEKEVKAEQIKIENLNQVIEQKQTLIKKAETQEMKLKAQQSDFDAIHLRLETLTKKAVAAVKCGMTSGEVRSVLGMSRGNTHCASTNYESYGGIWVGYNGGSVVCIVKSEDWRGPCYPCESNGCN